MNGLLDYLTPDQQRMAQQQATTQGLLGLGSALLQSSQGAPGQRRPSLGQVLGQALPVGIQSYQGGIDQALRQVVAGQQMQELQRKRQQEERARMAQEQLAQMTQPTTPLAALSAPGQAGPTVARAGMIGETPQISREQMLRLAMNPDLPNPDREALFKYAEATKPVEPKTPPGTIGEYVAGRNLGIIPQNTTYPEFLEMKKPPAPSAVATATTGKPFTETLDKNLSALKGQMRPASQALNTIQNMQGLLDEGVKTGFGQGVILKFAQAGQLFNPDYKAKDVAGQEAFIAASNEIILPQVKMLGVNPTDTDLNFINQGSPTLSKSVDGNRLMLKALQLKFERDKALANWATQWQSKNVGLITSNPILADSRMFEDMQKFMDSTPMFSQAAQQLRAEYNNIVNRQQSSALPSNNPFVRPR